MDRAICFLVNFTNYSYSKVNHTIASDRKLIVGNGFFIVMDTKQAQTVTIC